MDVLAFSVEFNSFKTYRVSFRLSCLGDRKDQTGLARLASGHLKPLRFSRGDKKFNICTKCNMIEATPQHLLDCVALVCNDLLKRPDFVLEVMKANDLMDLIRFISEGLENKN
ncbi:hypothetical protein AVEN_224886-1 [Araneus ventricosus]|uniref:Uncharacterized protein n=1 Tax=Araneus ventricosus TaxID=182803 RepID=A0A4Y2PNC8_ARAVE|nr:hypothetical protein AVEN_224886-1 [Araneus ventricosus]